MTSGKRENLVSGGIALGSLFFLLWIIPTYTPPYPGYGVSSALLPNVAVSIILALSVLSLLQNFIIFLRTKSGKIPKGQPKNIPEDDRVYFLQLVVFMLPCILLMPAMQWMGFIPGGLMFMVVIQFLCGQRKPITMVLVAVCSVGLLYAAMRYGLSVPMP